MKIFVIIIMSEYLYMVKVPVYAQVYIQAKATINNFPIIISLLEKR